MAYQPLTDQTKDEEICERVNAWFRDCESYHDTLLRAQNEAVQYYLGNQTRRHEVPAYNSDTVFNRIFEATETIIPIVTGAAHQFMTMPAQENEVSLERARKHQQVLNLKYEELEIRSLLEVVVRDIILKRFGVIEYGWDSQKDDVGVWVRDPRSIYIPKVRRPAHELDYVIRIAEFTAEQISEEFDVDIDTLKSGSQRTISRTGDTESSDEIYQVEIIYTPEVFIYKHGETILEKIANPLFDFTGASTTTDEATGEEYQYYGSTNYLARPEIPLVFFAPFRTGDGPVADTGLADVAIPIQDDINVAKRQILDNLRRMGNSQVYVDSDAMSSEQRDAITNEPGLILHGPNLASENRIRREPATPIPGTHFSNLADSIASFDNVFGTHGALRGAANNETLGGQIMDRQQNMSRIEQLTRELNRGMSRLAKGLTQVMKLYYTEEQVIRMMGSDGAVEFLRFLNTDIEPGVVIHTKSGTPPMLDPVARHNQAIQLWQLQAIDPETLFERLEFDDPQMTAQKLAAWRAGQLLLESQVKTAAERQTANATAANTQQTRNVETPNNVIDRANQQVTQAGRGQAPLTNTPLQ